MEVNIHQAKTHLSKLLQKVANGEEVIIARSGVPFARIVLIERESAKLRPMGMDRGKIVVPDDFNAPLPEHVLAQFYGGELPKLERPPHRKRR